MNFVRINWSGNLTQPYSSPLDESDDDMSSVEFDRLLEDSLLVE